MGSRIFLRSLIISILASFVVVVSIIFLLVLSTSLSFAHFLKALPSLAFLTIFVSGFEWYFFDKWLKNTKEFDRLKAEAGDSDELGPQALLAQEELVHYPLRGAVLVFLLWCFCGAFLAGTLILPWGATFFLWEIIFVFVISILGGMVALVFHFYFFRIIVRREAKEILEYETGYHLSQQEVGFLNLKRKLRLSLLPIFFATLILLICVGYFQSSMIVRGIYIQHLEALKREIKRSARTIKSAQDQLERFVRMMGIYSFLSDKDGKDPLSGIDLELPSKLIELFKTSKKEHFTYRYNTQVSLLVSQLGEIQGKKLFLIMLYDWDKFRYLQNRLLWVMVLVGVGMLIITIYIARLISMDLEGPISQMMDETEKIASGDLSANFNILSNDELGILSARLKSMTLNLREIVERVKVAYQRLDEVLEQILKSSEMVSEGAKEQVSVVEETSKSTAQVSQTIKEVSDNVEVLHRSGRETMERAEEMIKLVEEVEENLEEMTRAVEASSSSIYEISASIKQIANNVEELHSRSEETSQAVIEMEASIRQVAESIKSSRELAEQMRKSAEQGVNAVQETIQGIGNIEDTVSEARSVIEHLGKSTEQIGKILKVIREVANQTNLLALNAAIIAAQAGEQGQGFAVVADEIKNLADRVANSTVEIDEIIKQVQQDTVNVISVMEKSYEQVEKGVNLSYVAGEALERIMKNVDQSFKMSEQIQQATHQQVENVQKATKEISSIAELIEQITISVREQNKGADLLAQAGEEIKRVTELVRSSSAREGEEARRVQVAMENVEQMIKFILDSQRAQAQASERIVEAINRVKNIAIKNAESMSSLDKNIAILHQQAEILAGILKQFRSGKEEEVEA